MKILRRPLAIGVTCAMLALSVSGGTSHAANHGANGRTQGPITVFAAASLKEAFTTIAARVSARISARVVLNFGGSQELLAQLTQGSPADVFASASEVQMGIAQSKGLLASRPVVFARNRLVVIVPRTNPGQVNRLFDLGRPGVRLVVAAEQVPAGQYARAAFAAMAKDPAFGAGFLQRVEANIVSNELDVKAVVSKVELGEADAGVVYVTDVTRSVAPQLRRVAIPAQYNQVATYPIALVKGGQNAPLARQFLKYVLSASGQRVLKQDGFLMGAACRSTTRAGVCAD